MTPSRSLPRQAVEALVRSVGSLSTLVAEVHGVEYMVGVAEYDDGRIEITLTPMPREVA